MKELLNNGTGPDSRISNQNNKLEIKPKEVIKNFKVR
jgi:hypothetical protein